MVKNMGAQVEFKTFGPITCSTMIPPNTGDFGELTKQQHLDSDRHREKAQRVTRKIDNEHFRFYGDAALLTEIDHASDAAGKADFLTTTLWVRRGETWKITHMHYSKLAVKP
jgi:uncharacterized protein DUF4440